MLELSSGIPVLKMSHGSGFVMLQFPSHLNVADKKWHQLEVRTSGQVSYLIFFFFLPHQNICISNSISLCRNRGVEKTDWVILRITLTMLVDLMNNTNFGEKALSVKNLRMWYSRIRGVFFLFSKPCSTCGMLHIRCTHLDTKINYLCTESRSLFICRCSSSFCGSG